MALAVVSCKHNRLRNILKINYLIIPLCTPVIMIKGLSVVHRSPILIYPLCLIHV